MIGATLFLLLSVVAWQEPATLAAHQLPASGERETLLEVTRAGRYSLAVTSAQGVALELVDRMGGPIASDGEPGVADGRIDAFLDAATYKVRLHGPESGEGSAKLTIQAFVELEASPRALWDH